MGSPARTDGLAVGSALGSADGRAVVGSNVGTELGAAVAPLVGARVGKAVGTELGAAVATMVGAKVGAYVTKARPAPATTTVPVHAVDPTQPSRIWYVCGGVLAGTVYCTCAHTLPPAKQAAGGLSPFPVSSYTTSTPDAEYTRNTVWPKHVAPAYSALHIDAVNVCPALAVTPQSAKLVVSALVFIESR